MKALDVYFLMVVFTLLLNRVHVFANFMFNLNMKGLIFTIICLVSSFHVQEIVLLQRQLRTPRSECIVLRHVKPRSHTIVTLGV